MVCREREREAAARQRHNELISERREQEIKRKLLLERTREEQEMQQLNQSKIVIDAREQRRLETIRKREDEEREKERERRKKAQVESKREQNLRVLEMQRLREEEIQRATRESILAKRREMERVRDEAERKYQERKHEEAQRKVLIVQEMRDRREQRLVELERRRADPILLQQEREFSQLIEVQASLGRLHLKLENGMAGREDVRERLLEARHVVELLEAEERLMTIGVDEVESDVRKLTGYERALASLVTTRYNFEEYEQAVVTIQRYWRGTKGRKRAWALAEERKQREEARAALMIQKRVRGRVGRRLAKEETASRVTASERARIEHERREKLKRIAIKLAVERAAIRIQQAGRKFLATRRVERELVEPVLVSPRREGGEGKGGGGGGRGRGGRGGRGGGGVRGASVSPPSARRSDELRPAKRRAQQEQDVRQLHLANGELGRIYGINAGGPRAKGGVAVISPRARRFVPVAATAAEAARAEQDGTFAYFPDVLPGINL